MKHTHDRKKEVEEVVSDDATDLEVTLEEDESVGVSMKDKLKALRDELADTRTERDEHLAGWQRAKADLVNYRRMVAEDKERDTLRAKGAVIHAIIPALDSFEGAIHAESWHAVDKEWRDGVERIYNQFMKALEKEGLEPFGAAGEPFDPAHHECMSVVPTEDASKDHTIAQVLQRGYKMGTETVRPAKVIVAQSAEHA